MKTIQELIFSEEFDTGIDEAIKAAVARADAAGLPKAYIDDYDELAAATPSSSSFSTPPESGDSST